MVTAAVTTGLPEESPGTRGIKRYLFITIAAFCSFSETDCYSGGTDSFEKFTAEFSASAPVVYKKSSSHGPRHFIHHPLVLGRGSKCPWQNCPPTVVVCKIPSPSFSVFKIAAFFSDPTEIPPPYRETSVAIPLSHCVSCGIADYRCYTPPAFQKIGVSQSKDRPNKGVSQKKLASEAYRATGGVARDSIANHAIVGH